ncbi:O-antigen ligase family protein [Tepidiphilus margaritifer]|uniref:O-antigen ligase family protein n=1 Tax=Tepidiphilus margaritifer TaxID=203471 RepID=UPI0003F7000F|nr:O-antigen ligase family protein [Tepidiphilus margaritifer]
MKSAVEIFRFASIEAFFCLLALVFPALWLATGGGVKVLVRILLLMSLILLVRRQEMRRDVLIVFCMIFSVGLIGEYFWQYLTVPERLFHGRFPSNYIYFFSFFLVLAYGTVAWRRISPFLLLTGALVGLLAFLIWHTPSQQWILSWHGERVDFGFRNAEHAGIFFGAGLLCTLFFGIRIYRSCPVSLRFVAIGGIVLLLLLMMWGVIATQVRAVWLALLVALSASLLIAMMTGGAKTIMTWLRNRNHVILVLLMIALSVVILDALKVRDRLAARLAQETIQVETIRGAANFDEQIQLTSSGARIAMWRAARDWIAERPMFGWGVFSAENLIDADERFTPIFKEWFGHLHNSYIEALVATGIVGLVGMLSIVGLIGRSVYVAWQEGAMPRDVFFFSWAFIVFWGIVNFFESYINYKTGFYLNSVMFGFMYAFYLQRPTAPRRADEAIG